MAGLRGRGFVFTVEGQRLLVRPGSRLTPSLSEAIRRHRPELIALLSAEAESRRAPVTAADRALAAHQAALPAAPVRLVEAELVTLAGRAAAFAPGEWERLLDWDRRWRACCRAAWERKCRREGIAL